MGGRRRRRRRVGPRVGPLYIQWQLQGAPPTPGGGRRRRRVGPRVCPKKFAKRSSLSIDCIAQIA